MKAQVPSYVKAAGDGGQILLINNKSGLMFTIDGSGAVIWNEMMRGTSMTQVAQILEHTFGIAPE